MSHPVIALIETLKSQPKFWMAKAITQFQLLPPAYQEGILGHIVAAVGGDKWEALVADPFAWSDLIRSILWHYSGREERKTEPSPTDLATLIAEYVRTPGFKAASETVVLRRERDGKPSFTDMLGEIE